MKKPKKGDVFLVSLDPTIGTEINKTRPGLIVSNDVGNNNSPRVIVAPITSNVSKIYPFNVYLDELKKPSKALLNQVRSVDKRRLIKFLAKISDEHMEEVDAAIKIVFDLV
ncbi:type II toxin-antitoxin system PemK/MazF family toxin [bacterium]|nr:type II toxin-antitoxin system PemK/MazF family toxin [bacterium]